MVNETKLSLGMQCLRSERFQASMLLFGRVPGQARRFLCGAGKQEAVTPTYKQAFPKDTVHTQTQLLLPAKTNTDF